MKDYFVVTQSIKISSAKQIKQYKKHRHILTKSFIISIYLSISYSNTIYIPFLSNTMRGPNHAKQCVNLHGQEKKNTFICRKYAAKRPGSTRFYHGVLLIILCAVGAARSIYILPLSFTFFRLSRSPAFWDVPGRIQNQAKKKRIVYFQFADIKMQGWQEGFFLEKHLKTAFQDSVKFRIVIWAVCEFELD